MWIMPMEPAHLQGQMRRSGCPSSAGVPSSSVPRQIRQTISSFWFWLLIKEEPLERKNFFPSFSFSFTSEALKLISASDKLVYRAPAPPSAIVFLEG